VIKSGDFKDVGSPLREMTEAERELLQDFIDNVHEQFITAVADGRAMPKEAVRAIADGRILSGEQAQRLGLLDGLGNIEDAIVMAAELGGISGEPSVVYAEKERFSILQLILGSRIADALDEITSAVSQSGYVYVPGRAENG
jgi:protease-4